MLVEETLDWKEATFPVLSAVAEQLSLNPVASPDVTALFMDLMCNYALVHLMFDSFAYRKEVVVYYAAAFEAVNNRPEPNFERITRYIVEVRPIVVVGGGGHVMMGCVPVCVCGCDLWHDVM